MSDKQQRQQNPHGNSRGSAAPNKPRQGPAYKSQGNDTKAPRKLETRNLDSHKDETKVDAVKTGDKKGQVKDVKNAKEEENRPKRKLGKPLTEPELRVALSSSQEDVERLRRAKNEYREEVQTQRQKIESLQQQIESLEGQVAAQGDRLPVRIAKGSEHGQPRVNMFH